MAGQDDARDISPLGPIRARLLLAGLPVFWLGGAIAFWSAPTSVTGLVIGWIMMAIAPVCALVAGLSALVRNDATRLAFPGSVLAIFARARVSLRVYVVVALIILVVGLAGFPRFLLSP